MRSSPGEVSRRARSGPYAPANADSDNAPSVAIAEDVLLELGIGRTVPEGTTFGTPFERAIALDLGKQLRKLDPDMCEGWWSQTIKLLWQVGTVGHHSAQCRVSEEILLLPRRMGTDRAPASATPGQCGAAVFPAASKVLKAPRGSSSSKKGPMIRKAKTSGCRV